MGLLEDLLGQLSGSVPGRGANAPRSEGGMTNVMVALLPVVLGMLASGQRGEPARGGGLGDILGRMFGGASGGSGGLGGLLDQFRRAGFGEQASSWVGTGPNRPIPPDAVEKVFGRDGVAEIARQAGVSEHDASSGLSQLMPEVVDRVTPSGELPDSASLLASLESLTKRFDAT
jgi:uncharacterized protein YidB (DUF937 family)